MNWSWLKVNAINVIIFYYFWGVGLSKAELSMPQEQFKIFTNVLTRSKNDI